MFNLVYSFCVRIFLLGVMVMCWPVLGNASSFKQMSIDEMVQDSALIFEGIVENVSYKIPSDRNRIYTFVTFKILDILKGNYAEQKLVLRYPGGELNGMVDQVSDMTVPKLGEQGIYFVKSLTEHFVHPLTGWTQGQMLILHDKQGNEGVYSVSLQPVQAISLDQSRAKVDTNHSAPEAALGVVTGQSGVPALSVFEAKRQLQRIIKDE